MKDLDPRQLAAQARQTELNAFVELLEDLCAEKGVTIGEWSLIVKTIDNRQNSYLINSKIQKYAKPDEGGNAPSIVK